MKTRPCIAASAAPTLSQEGAAATLLEGHQRLTAFGQTEPCLIQSNAGSDFTASHVQQVWSAVVSLRSGV